jgi:type I site-specific restriction-modification system R (restriction) subunit
MQTPPKHQVKLRKESGKAEVFDLLRKKWLVLTPEEEVRQKMILFLLNKKGYPAGRLASEYSLKVNELKRRADIVAFDKFGHPILIVECKAPKVKITQTVFDQIARYNLSLRVDYLVVTNGSQNYCCMMDFMQEKYQFLEDIPDYNSII